MATKFCFGYVSKYLVDLWTSPSDRPLAHKGYNNRIIFDAQKIHPNLSVNLLIFQ